MIIINRAIHASDSSTATILVLAKVKLAPSIHRLSQLLALQSDCRGDVGLGMM